MAANAPYAKADAAADGLYDEPAFSLAGQKANPVYDSTDNLAGEEEDTGDKSGYLDVAPNGAAGTASLSAADSVALYDAAVHDAGYTMVASNPGEHDVAASAENVDDNYLHAAE